MRDTMLNVAVALGTAPRPRPGGARRAGGCGRAAATAAAGGAVHATCGRNLGCRGAAQPRGALELRSDPGIHWSFLETLWSVPTGAWVDETRARPPGRPGPARGPLPGGAHAGQARCHRQGRSAAAEGAGGGRGPAGRSGSPSSEADVAWNAAAAEGTRTRHLPTSLRLKTRPTRLSAPSSSPRRRRGERAGQPRAGERAPGPPPSPGTG